MNTFLPAKLKPNATVGIIQPAGAISQQAYTEALAKIKTLGFELYQLPQLPRQHGYLGGTDQERIHEIHTLFANPQIDAIWCIRGGYGIQRILPLLDLQLIARNPKPLIGFSDITALLNYITAHTGLITYHGIMGVSSFSSFEVNSFKSVVMQHNFPHTLSPASNTELCQQDPQTYTPFVIQSGTAIGQLIGGNLALLSSAVGTPFDVDYDNKILLLEEIGEAPYRIDRMLTQLLHAGKLDHVAGIALGIFNQCQPENHNWKPENSFSLREVLTERLAHLNIPIMYGLPFGHIQQNATLPIGGMAMLNTHQMELTILPQKQTC